jgi:hypothetical protein
MGHVSTIFASFHLHPRPGHGFLNFTNSEFIDRLKRKHKEWVSKLSQSGGGLNWSEVEAGSDVHQMNLWGKFYVLCSRYFQRLPLLIKSL